MTRYRYGTLLEVQTDDPHPDSDVEVGDLHIRAGKLKNGDQYEVLTQEGAAVVEMETVAVYESAQKLPKRRMHEFVRDRAAEDPEVDI